MEFWLKTIEFGDITIKSVGDFKLNLVIIKLFLKFQYLVMHH